MSCIRKQTTDPTRTQRQLKTYKEEKMKLRRKKVHIYLPDTKLGVVDDVVGHGKFSLVLRRVNVLDLTDNAALRFQDPTVLLRHVG